MSYNPANYPIADSDVLRGSLIITFNNPNNDANAYYTVNVNSTLRNQEYYDSNSLFTTYLYVGDVVTVTIYGGEVSEYLDVIRTDFTTDAEYGDNGITTVNVTSVSGSGEVTFTATTVNTSYNFEYHVDMGTLIPPTPTPTPSITATNTPTPSITPTLSLSATPSVTPTLTPTNTATPTQTNTPTSTVTPSITPSITPTSLPPGFENDGKYVLSVSTTNELFVSADYGDSWTQVYLPSTYPVYDACISSNGYIMYVASSVSGGILKSIDGGYNWTQVFTTTNMEAWGSIDCDSSGTYVGAGQANNFFTGNQFQYYYSTNGGTNWSGIDRVPGGSTDYEAVYVQNVVNKINGWPQYSVAFPYYEFPITGYQNLGISNSGERFSAYLSGNTNTRIVTSFNNNIQMVGIKNSTSFKYTSNGGSTFTTKSITGPTGEIDFDMNYNGADIIAWGTGNGLWRSTDFGDSWTNVKSNINPVDAVNSASGKYIYVATGSTGTYVSKDFGDTFTLSPLTNNIKIIRTNKDIGTYPPPSPTPSVTPTITPTNTVTATVTPTITPSITKTPTPTRTVTRTVTPTPTVTPSSVTPTPTPSLTSTITPTPSVTSTITPTMSMTPTPSVTPIPINIKYRYIGQNGNTTTKTVSSRRIVWGGETFTVGYNTNWTTSANTGEINLGTSYVFSGSMAGYRNICRSTSGSQTINDYTVNIYVNGTLYKTYTNTTNTLITTCPTQINSNRTFSGCDFTGGDNVVLEWVDNMVF
jgi:photosystem II stability/assembly factor-like uncharacterized protein